MESLIAHHPMVGKSSDKDDFTSFIYNDRPAKHDAAPFGENYMPQASQSANQGLLLWVIDPRSRTRKKPTRNRLKPTAPARRKKRPKPPSRRPSKSGSHTYRLSLLMQVREGGLHP